MGRIITLPTSIIRPNEEGLKPTTLEGVLMFYQEGREKILLPPAVRQDGKSFYTIDGRHRLAIADVRYGKSQVYIPESPKDIMTEELFPNIPKSILNETNRYIRFRFLSAKDLAPRLARMGIQTYSQLREKEGIQTYEDALKFCGLN